MFLLWLDINYNGQCTSVSICDIHFTNLRSLNSAGDESLLYRRIVSRVLLFFHPQLYCTSRLEWIISSLEYLPQPISSVMLTWHVLLVAGLPILWFLFGWLHTTMSQPVKRLINTTGLFLPYHGQKPCSPIQASLVVFLQRQLCLYWDLLPNWRALDLILKRIKPKTKQKTKKKSKTQDG